MKRKPVNKHASANKFKHNISRTKVVNIPRVPMRGGWRL